MVTTARRTPPPRRFATPKARRPDRGVMLVLTLWLGVVLAILASSLTAHLILQTRLMSMRRHWVVADSLARAGVARAIVDLKNDLVLDNTEDPQVFDAEGDIWKRPEDGKREVELGRGMFDVEVIDEESKININKANPQILTALLVQLGYEEPDAQIAAAAIVDWRDSDDKALIEGMTDRFENEVYALLFMGIEPRDDFGSRRDVVTMPIKNDDYITVDELLWVYGVTPDLFFGPGTPEAEAMMAQNPERWAYAERSRRFQMKRTRSRFASERPVGLRDCVTVFSTGAVNINTASLEVLAALVRASDSGIADPETVAARIIEHRRDGRRDDFNNNKAFRTPQDLGAVANLGVGANIGAAYPIDVKSQTFTIVSTGTHERYSRTIRLVVRRNWEQYTRGDGFDDWKDRRERNRQQGLMPGRIDDSALKSGRYGPDERTILWPAVRGLQWIEH